jgi:hypothetical protein
VFSWVKTISFLQNQPIQIEGRSTVALVRESLMLEARGSISLFNIVNSVCSLKEYCLPLHVFMSEENQLCSKQPLSCEWRSTVSLVIEPLMIEARGAIPFFSIVN